MLFVFNGYYATDFRDASRGASEWLLPCRMSARALYTPRRNISTAHRHVGKSFRCMFADSSCVKEVEQAEEVEEVEAR